MWPFIFIIALVPLIFYWSDSVRELFPSLSHYLPDKDAKGKGIGGGSGPDATIDAAQSGQQPGVWVTAQTAAGYVAWVLSQDLQYRLTIGCAPGKAPSLQVTLVTGQPPGGSVELNYQYGALALTSGFYAGSDLVGAVSQFAEIQLQSGGRVLTGFQLDSIASGGIARTLTQQCAAV